MNLLHVFLRYTTTGFFPIGESRVDLLNSLKRNLEIRSLRPVGSMTYEEILSRLLEGKYQHISEFDSLVSYVDCPSWVESVPPYVPDSARLVQAEQHFKEVKDLPVYEDDLMDNAFMSEWDNFFYLGKTALWVYCRDHTAASQVQTPKDRGDLIREALEKINGEASRVVDIPDFPRLAESLRVDPENVKPSLKAPLGLLKGLSQLLMCPTSFDVGDPLQWWKLNEHVIPDLTVQRIERVLGLEEL